MRHDIDVKVNADTSDYRAAMAELGKASGLGKLGGVLGGVGRAVAGVSLAAGAAAAGIGVASVGIAGSLQQSAGAVATVFKAGADDMARFADGAAESVGLAEGSYNELATVLGTQLKNGGTAMDDLAAKTDGLIGHGADLASMFGGTTADAVSALSSALKGERDPIERYGVSLTQARIDAKAAELGFSKVGGALTAQGTQAATLALIMEQTADASGNFARESGTWQGTIQRGKAILTDIAGTVGTAVLPMLTSLATTVVDNLEPAFARVSAYTTTTLLPALTELGGWVRGTLLPAMVELGGWLNTNVVPVLVLLAGVVTDQLIPAVVAVAGWVQRSTGWLIPLAAAVLAGVAAFQLWTGAIRLWSLITKAAAVTQALLNAVMAANPILLVVIVLAALVAALVVAWRTNERFRRVVTGAWQAVSSAARAGGRWFMDTCRAIGSAAAGAWRSISGAFTALPARFASWFGSARTNATNALTGLITTVAGLPGRITGALGNLAGLLFGAGADVVRGLINGLGSMLSKVQDKAREIANAVTSAAKNALGMKSPSRVFATIGRDTVAGLELGLARNLDKVRDAGADLAGALSGAASGGMPDLAAMAGGVTSPGGAGVMNVTLNVTATPGTDRARLGAEMTDILRTFARRGGRR